MPVFFFFFYEHRGALTFSAGGIFSLRSCSTLVERRKRSRGIASQFLASLVCFLHLSCSLCLVQRGGGKAHSVSQTTSRTSVQRSGLRVSSKGMPAPQSDPCEQDVPPVWVVRPVAKECPLRRQTFAKVSPSGMGAGGIHAEECPLRGLTLAKGIGFLSSLALL